METTTTVASSASPASSTSPTSSPISLSSEIPLGKKLNVCAWSPLGKRIWKYFLRHSPAIVYGVHRKGAGPLTITRGTFKEAYAPKTSFVTELEVGKIRLSVAYDGEEKASVVTCVAETTEELQAFIKSLYAEPVDSNLFVTEYRSLGGSDCSPLPIEKLKSSVLSEKQTSLLELLQTQFSDGVVSTLAAKGIPPRYNLLFVGPPGTGKTHFAMIIALTLKRNLYRITRDSEAISTAAYRITEPAVIVFEDADAIGPDRELLRRGFEPGSSLSPLLSILDGTRVPHLFILTTNYPEKLDSALSRAGRIGATLHFGPIEKRHVLPICQTYFDEEEKAKKIAARLEQTKSLTVAMTSNFCRTAFLRSVTNGGALPTEEDYKELESGAYSFSKKWRAEGVGDIDGDLAEELDRDVVGDLGGVD